MPGRGALQEQERSERRGTGNERNRKRDDKRLSLQLLAKHRAFTRKDHPERNEKQHDTAGDADRFLFKAKKLQDISAEKQEHKKDDVSDQNLAHKHETPPFRRNCLQDREEQQNVPERVHDEEQRDDRRKDVHFFQLSAEGCQLLVVHA